MWSFGCILYELYIGYPLFAGEDEKEQMQCIMEVKGVPPRSMIVLASRRKVFFNDDYQPIGGPNSKGKLRQINGKKLSNLMQASEETYDFVDFLDKCLEWKPEKRMTPDEAFKHPWIRAGIKELRQKMEQGGAPQSAGQAQPTTNQPSLTVSDNVSKRTVDNSGVGLPGLPTINDS